MVLEGDTQSASPQGTGDDAVQPAEPRHSPIAATPAGRLLQQYVATANGADEGAEEQYQDALGQLREHADEVVVEIARALGHCSDEDYPLRWLLVHAAAELRDEQALPLLVSVAKTPIPDEISPDPHSFSSVQEETIVRTTAVDGVAALAARGSERAEEELFAFLSLPSFSIRRAAVAGLMGAPRGEELLERIADCLPENERFLLDLRKVDVRDVEQISDPKRHLSEAGRAQATEAPPEFGGGRDPDDPNDSPTSSKGDAKQRRPRTTRTTKADDDSDSE